MSIIETAFKGKVGFLNQGCFFDRRWRKLANHFLFCFWDPGGNFGFFPYLEIALSNFLWIAFYKMVFTS